MVILAVFVVGLGFRVAALGGSHNEGDELVYRTLVQQLELGRGYTLKHTVLIGQGWPEAQYGQDLFFHPPGGVALFWVLHLFLGDAGYPAADASAGYLVADALAGYLLAAG